MNTDTTLVCGFIGKNTSNPFSRFYVTEQQTHTRARTHTTPLLYTRILNHDEISHHVKE